MNIEDRVVSLTPTFVTPDHLSWFRIWVVPVLWGLYLVHPLLAFCVYVLACVSDWLDGQLARARGVFSKHGKRLDEVSDKILVLGVIALLSLAGIIPVRLESPLLWVVVIMLFREVFITTLRELWPERARQVPVLFSAKVKTFLTMIALGMLMLGGLKNPFWHDIAMRGALLLVVAGMFSVHSGVLYTYHFFEKR